MPTSEWTQQPENDPRPARAASGVVAGVLVCNYHRDVLGGLRTAHGSLEGHALRVAQVAASCQACQEAQR